MQKYTHHNRDHHARSDPHQKPVGPCGGRDVSSVDSSVVASPQAVFHVKMGMQDPVFVKLLAAFFTMLLVLFSVGVRYGSTECEEDPSAPGCETKMKWVSGRPIPKQGKRALKPSFIAKNSSFNWFDAAAAP